MNRKTYKIILLLSIGTLIGALHKEYIGTGHRADVFLFYDYPDGGRLISNILNDIGKMFTVSISLYLLFKYSIYSYIKNATLPFFWISILDILDYFLFFKQLSIIKLPILLILLVIYNVKHEKRNNAG